VFIQRNGRDFENVVDKYVCLYYVYYHYLQCYSPMNITIVNYSTVDKF
jgi:hypothetical protein